MSFLDNLDIYKNKDCIVDNNKIFSYKEILEVSQKFTDAIPKRSLVFLLGGNNYETLISYIGLIRSKSVITLLDKDINIKNLKNLIKKYSPNYIILPDFFDKINGYTNIKNLKNYYILEKISNKKIIMNDELAILLTTSGSTGSPKLVRLSYKNYLVNSAQIIRSLQLKNSSTITTLPIHYTYGLSIINTHLISGGKIILNTNSILEKKFWSIYKKYKPNIFYGVPYIYEILNKLKFKNFFHKKLKTFTNAGGKLKDITLKKIMFHANIHEIKFYLMYGQTEASPRMSYLPHRYNNKKFNSIGKSVIGGAFSLLDTKNNEINTPHTEGELIYNGENVSLGYSNNKWDLKKEDTHKKKLFTGDLAIFDEDNFFYITGRKKRIIKLFGIRISLDDIEDILLKEYKLITNCETNDDRLIINYSKKKINEKKIVNKLSSKINLNQNYIKFKLVKIDKIKNNKNKAI